MICALARWSRDAVRFTTTFSDAYSGLIYRQLPLLCVHLKPFRISRKDVPQKRTLCAGETSSVNVSYEDAERYPVRLPVC